MVRRRPTDAEVEVPLVPRHLARFVLAEWVGEVPPEPEWWAERAPRPEYPWEVFKARLLWQEARREWAAAHGVTPVEAWQQQRDAARSGARTLAEVNRPYERGRFVEADEDDDLRVRHGGSGDG